MGGVMMTKEEAIRLIGWLKCTTNREDDLEAIDMAIEALSADAISREFYEDAVKANIRLVIENRELKEQIESTDAEQGFRGGKIPPKEILNGTVLIPQHQWLEMERELAELKEKFESADAVEVVRCKDCKHYIVEGITTQYGWCHEYKHSVNEDDYCSYGEREESEVE